MNIVLLTETREKSKEQKFTTTNSHAQKIQIINKMMAGNRFIKNEPNILGYQIITLAVYSSTYEVLNEIVYKKIRGPI